MLDLVHQNRPKKQIAQLWDEIKSLRNSRDSSIINMLNIWKQLDFSSHSCLILLLSGVIATVGLRWHFWAGRCSCCPETKDTQPTTNCSTKATPGPWNLSSKGKAGSFLPPETRVFVLSVLGLRSSGKSTLLNAVFGNPCGEFSGCTRGLVFRLHRFSSELSTRLKLDAMLVIDSEGLGSVD